MTWLHPSFGILRSPLKSWVMVGIYLLHLLFFQGLMVDCQGASSFQPRPFHVHHKHGHGHNHKALGDYVFLLKQESPGQHNFHLPVNFIAQSAPVNIPQIPSLAEPGLQHQTDWFRVSASSFKLYKRLKVFRI